MTISSVKTGAVGLSLALDNNYMEPIATTFLSSTSNSIAFNDIPQTYKHLQLRYSVRGDAAGSGGKGIQIQINSDNSTNYTRHRFGGWGSGNEAVSNVSQTSIVVGYMPHAGHTAGNFGGGYAEILDYSSNVKNKTIRALAGYDNNATDYGYIHTLYGLWMQTTSVNSITCTLSDNGNFVQYSRISLYGIKG